MRAAAIDIGSNSIHLVVAQVERDGRLRVLDRAKEMVRLGQRSLLNGRLSADAMNLGVQTLSTFKKLAERHGVQRTVAVATSAVREARNGGDFVQRIKDEVGLRVKVIPGREEARFIHLGVRHAIDLRTEPTLIVDAGGGSVEMIVNDGDRAVALESFKLGVSRLSEKYVDADRPTARALEELEGVFATQLKTILETAKTRNVQRIVVTSGTLLNIVSIAGYLRADRPEGSLNNYTVADEDIARVRRTIIKADREERGRVKGMDTKRVDFVVPGVCLAEYVLRTTGAKRMVACTWALREGVLLDFVARHGSSIDEADRFEDPRRRSVVRLARHLGETGPHGAHVARLALVLFGQLHDFLGLFPESAELLEYAALMHDVGHHISHSDHQRHSYYLITNGELLGFQREEIEMIGLVARYHRKGVPRDGDPGYSALSKPGRRTVRALSALLRVADGLDRSHYGVVNDISVIHSDKALVLRLNTDGDAAELEMWEARRRAGLLEELLDTKIEFEIAKVEGRHAERAASVSR